MRSLIGRPKRQEDPAPSRLAYRLHRIMLRPVLRFAVIYGLPVGLVLAALGVYFGDQQRRDAVRLIYNQAATLFVERPEFMIDLMSISGASDDVAQDIREVLNIDFPISSFDLDSAQMRETILGLDPVKEARVNVHWGEMVQIEIEERRPAIIWRTREALELLDETGAYVRTASSRLDYPQLNLIAGAGADQHVVQALALYDAARPLAERLRGMVYVGQRRWDVALDRDQRLMLPERDPVQALERIIGLDQAQDLLARDIEVVDMRLESRMTLRLGEEALLGSQDVIQMKTGD
ncbi:cell division protein FtsQ/DivIB [Rhodobacteraceae bacterium]|nr:cell division protein FtsQ/DivIB [Paracoccaceae bacterium]